MLGSITMKKFIVFVLMTYFIISATTTSVLANTNIEANNYDRKSKKEVSVSDSASVNDIGKVSGNISIADNINLFISRSSVSNTAYSLMWAKSKTFDDTDFKVNGYGVVVAYSLNSNPDIWFLEMNSNIRPNQYLSMNKFDWSVEHDNSKTTIIDWSPRGTTTAESGGFPITVSLKIPNSDYTIGTSFTLLKKKSKLSAAAAATNYSVKLETNSINLIYWPDYQHLNAAVHYLTDTKANTTWSWTWSWNTFWEV